jgi:transposase, IS30 family
MGKTRITFVEREVIEKMIKFDKTDKEIATVLLRHRTSILREIYRNASYRYSYNAFYAQVQYELRKTKPRIKYITENAHVIKFVTKNISKYSPDVISGRAILEKNNQNISTESIYRIIYNNKQNGGSLWEYLPSRRKKRKTIRFNKENTRGYLKNQQSIRLRPKGANNRSRLGHFEGDTLVGRDHKSMIFTAIDRKSRSGFAHKLVHRNADGVFTAVKIMHNYYDHSIKSLTLDNGKEFACHENIKDELGINVYFADAGKPYQRGSSENFNRQLRRYFPKGVDFRKVSWRTIRSIIDKINNTPRKSLNYRTPFEVLGARHFCAILN